MPDGVIVATDERGHSEFMGTVANHPSRQEVKKRCDALIGKPFIQFVGNRAAYVNDERIHKDDVECVYNDCDVLNRILGEGAYESVATPHELAVLELAKKLLAKSN